MALSLRPTVVRSSFALISWLSRSCNTDGDLWIMEVIMIERGWVGEKSYEMAILEAMDSIHKKNTI